MISKELEVAAERQALKYLKSIGINATSVQRTGRRTPDYKWKDTGIEVSVLGIYFSVPPELQVTINYLQTNPGNNYAVYLYSDGKQQKSAIIRKESCDNAYLLLHTIQHSSYYRHKIIGKIDDKYIQSSDYQSQLVVLDFRVVPFSPTSIGKEITKVFDEYSDSYRALDGILIGLAHILGSPILEEPKYYLVKNPHSYHNIAELEVPSLCLPFSTDAELLYQLNIYPSGGRITNNLSVDIESSGIIYPSDIQKLGYPV